MLDPFAGSGSTIVAAQQLGIPAIGIERDPRYLGQAQRRMREQGNEWGTLFDVGALE